MVTEKSQITLAITHYLRILFENADGLVLWLLFTEVGAQSKDKGKYHGCPPAKAE